MRYINFVSTLLNVRLLRIFLLIRSAYTVIKLRLPVRYAPFNLLPLLDWVEVPNKPQQKSCDSRLTEKVDVVVSLYRFDKYKDVLKSSINSCLNNQLITFHFVLVSATAAEREWLEEVIGKSHHKMYVSDERIGIYKAWNMAIQGGVGKYITNLNADDLRLPHSICNQAAALDLESADGSFGNFVLSGDILSFLKSPNSRLLVSKLGELNETKLVMGSQNLMHCAPMWKRELHNRVGFFDSKLESCGDNDFWLRCLEQGAHFVPYAPVTAVYFHNPEGLSSSISSVGRKEWASIRDAFLRRKILG